MSIYTKLAVVELPAVVSMVWERPLAGTNRQSGASGGGGGGFNNARLVSAEKQTKTLSRRRTNNCPDPVLSNSENSESTSPLPLVAFRRLSAQQKISVPQPRRGWACGAVREDTSCSDDEVSIEVQHGDLDYILFTL
jgi:hypothetical protein